MQKLALGMIFGVLMMIIEMVLFIARSSIRDTQEKATDHVKAGKRPYDPRPRTAELAKKKQPID